MSSAQRSIVADREAGFEEPPPKTTDGRPSFHDNMQPCPCFDASRSISSGARPGNFASAVSSRFRELENAAVGSGDGSSGATIALSTTEDACGGTKLTGVTGNAA